MIYSVSDSLEFLSLSFLIKMKINNTYLQIYEKNN